jgi:hypothetical protein
VEFPAHNKWDRISQGRTLTLHGGKSQWQVNASEFQRLRRASVNRYPRIDDVEAGGNERAGVAGGDAEAA